MNKFKKYIALLLSAVSVFALGACNNKKIDAAKHYEDNDDYYEIKYYLPITTDGISTSFADMDQIEDKINDIIFPKINARVKFVQILYYSYNEQMTTRIASNETFDLCYTSPTINYYRTNIKRRAFLPIDTLLDDYGSHIKNSVPDYAWKQAEYSDGYKYGVVNQQIIPRTDACLVNSYALFDEFLSNNGYDGYNHENIYEYILNQKMHPYDILEEYVRWVKLNKKGLGGKMGAVDVQLSLQTRYHWDDLGTGMSVPGAVSCTDDKNGGIKVFDQFSTDEFKNDIKRSAGYYSQGLTPKSIKTGGYGTEMETYDVASLATWKPNDIRTNQDGEDAGAVRLGDPYYYISFVLGSMTAISSTSKNPARVMKFIDLMWTNSDILNLLCFGIEGEHYDKVESDDGCRIKLISNTGYSNSTMTWAYSSEFLDGVKYIDKYVANPYKKSQEINKTALLSDVIGFVFDESPVATQIAACKSVCTTYLTEFATGQHGADVMSVYDTFTEKLKAAGADAVIAEKQKQLDAWLGKGGAA